MRNIIYTVVLLLVGGSAFAQDPTLADVEDLQVVGDTLMWSPVEDATGYNILLNRRYFDTVRDTNSYPATEAGSYRIVAFNDSGEYGSDYGPSVEFGGAESDESVEYSYDFNTLIVRQTCPNVGPGESCIARCPTSYDPPNSNVIFPRYSTGGACTTSDIVEADSWVGHRSYHCTVPTFSGEVIAQAICRTR